MYLHTDTTCIEHRGDIGSDDGGDPSILSGIDDTTHELEVFVIDNRIDGEVALDAVLTAYSCYAVKVFGGEVIGTLGAHVQPLDAEVYRVSPRVDRRHERLV